MKLVRNVLQDLIEKKLWPVAVALVAGLVAVPVVLGGSSSSAGTPPAPTVAAAPTGPNTLADHRDIARAEVVSLDEQAAGAVNRAGKVRNPFVQHHVPKVPNANAAANAAVQATKALVKQLSNDNSSSAGGTSAAGAGGASTPVVPTTPATTTPSNGSSSGGDGSARATYGVTLKFGEPGAEKTYHNVARLTPLPSSDDPFFVYLGLADNGKSAVFMVDADADPSGDGTCMPSEDECEQVKLHKGDIEFFEMQSGTAGVVQYQLEVTAIAKATAASKASAAKVHARESRAGREYLREVLAQNPDALAGWDFSSSLGLLVQKKDDIANVPAEIVKSAIGVAPSTATPSFTAQP
jgi:hypothetical protein